MTCTISSGRGGSGGYCILLLRGARPARPRRRDRRPPPTRGIHHDQRFRHDQLLSEDECPASPGTVSQSSAGTRAAVHSRPDAAALGARKSEAEVRTELGKPDPAAGPPWKRPCREFVGRGCLSGNGVAFETGQSGAASVISHEVPTRGAGRPRSEAAPNLRVRCEQLFCGPCTTCPVVSRTRCVRYSWRDVAPPDSSASQAPIRNESGPRTRHRLLKGLCDGNRAFA